jgi:hypothetical protein
MNYDSNHVTRLFVGAAAFAAAVVVGTACTPPDEGEAAGRPSSTGEADLALVMPDAMLGQWRVSEVNLSTMTPATRCRLVAPG